MRKKKEVIEEIEPIEEETPLQVNNNEECEIEGNIIKKIPPAKWESFINILEFLTKDNDNSVIIEDSIILYSYRGSSIIKADLKEIFDTSMTLHISSPKKWTRLFKIFKDCSTYILEEENRFIVTNGQVKLFLPKQLGSYTASLEFPDVSESETVCDLIIQKEARDTILKLAKDSTYIEFLIKSNKLKCINIPNTAIYVLPEYLKDPDVKDLNSNNADLTLRSSVFLPYNSETYKIAIGRNLISGSYFLYTSCNSSSLSIEIYEQLDNASGVDQLF